MFEIDTREIKRMESDLETFARKALPFATRNTLNQAAFMAQREAKEGIRAKMVLRNRFTEQSIRVEQAKSLQIASQEAVTGSIADYMEDQEFGGVKSKRGKHGVAIATSYAAGQGEGVRPRTRLPRKPNKLGNIRLQRRRTGTGSRKQRNLIAIRQAVKTSAKHVFLDLGRRKGIFRVVGGKRRPKIKMVQDLTSQSVVIPRTPWLAPAVDKTEPAIPGFYAASLRFQLKRLRIFR